MIEPELKLEFPVPSELWRMPVSYGEFYEFKKRMQEELAKFKTAEEIRREMKEENERQRTKYLTIISILIAIIFGLLGALITLILL